MKKAFVDVTVLYTANYKKLQIDNPLMEIH